MMDDAKNRTQPCLDPEDWEQFRAVSHQALDRMIDFLASIRERPVWQEAPSEVANQFAAPLPVEGRDLSFVLDDFERSILPYTTGNLHPLFMGWVNGAGTPVGMIAEMLAAGLNANCGGRNHIGLRVEEQITLWMAEAFGFPRDASGVFVTGTSMANFMALLVAREKIAGDIGVRAGGVGALGKQLVAYTSSEAHKCVAQAMELSGIGSQFLRRIKSDADRRMDCGALQEAIRQDRAAGFQPFLIVGTAGSVDTGAIDDLGQIADIAQSERVWFHIDGAFGVLAVLSEKLRPLLRGLGRADSIAFDFHKWLQVPYDAGFLIVRDPVLHKKTFADQAPYLSRAPRGLAKGETWPCDLGPDLSRGFRALKTWFTIQVFGVDRLAQSIEQTCQMAQRLKQAIESSKHYTLVAPVALNIVCFSLNNDPDGRHNQEIVMELHTKGLAAPSITYLDGKPVIRCAFVNHRTEGHDIDRFISMLELCAGTRFQSSAPSFIV